jgi:hypothetical protein
MMLHEDDLQRIRDARTFGFTTQGLRYPGNGLLEDHDRVGYWQLTDAGENYADLLNEYDKLNAPPSNIAFYMRAGLVTSVLTLLGAAMMGVVTGALCGVFAVLFGNPEPGLFAYDAAVVGTLLGGGLVLNWIVRVMFGRS